MGVCQNIRRSTVLAEDVKNLLYRATFLRASVQLTVRVGSCPTLTKAVVTLRINLLSLSNLRQVLLTFTDIFATFYDDGTQTQFNEPKGSEQSTRTGSHHNDLRTTCNIRIIRPLEFVLLGLLVDVTSHFQIDEDSPLTRIDATLQHTHSRQRPHVKTILVSQECPQCTLITCHMRLNPDLVFVNHLPFLQNRGGSNVKYITYHS